MGASCELHRISFYSAGKLNSIGASCFIRPHRAYVARSNWLERIDDYRFPIECVGFAPQRAPAGVGGRCAPILPVPASGLFHGRREAEGCPSFFKRILQNLPAKGWPGWIEQCEPLMRLTDASRKSKTQLQAK